MPISGQPARVRSQLLRGYFDAMLRRFGPQQWWPARTRLEIILGAILTQNTSWQNAALGIKGLRRAGLLSMNRLKRAHRDDIESAIRSAGFYRQKTRTIRNFLAWLGKTRGGSLARMFRRPADQLRPELMEINGLGPETVDAILLYAGGIPSFVADAYTRRILSRHGLIPEEASYKRARDFLHSHLPAEAQLFNEFHALLVETGKRFCRRSAPDCEGCPLQRFLPGASPQETESKPDSFRKTNGARVQLRANLQRHEERIGPVTA